MMIIHVWTRRKFTTEERYISINKCIPWYNSAHIHIDKFRVEQARCLFFSHKHTHTRAQNNCVILNYLIEVSQSWQFCAPPFFRLALPLWFKMFKQTKNTATTKNDCLKNNNSAISIKADCFALWSTLLFTAPDHWSPSPVCSAHILAGGTNVRTVYT